MEGGGGDPRPSVSALARTPSEGDLDLLEQLLSGDNAWLEVAPRSPNSLASPPPAAFFAAFFDGSYREHRLAAPDGRR
jgi:hypothetical protein